MTIVGPVGRCHGVVPRAKTSTIIMRPPQHGQAGLLGSTAAVGWPGFATASSSRARAMLSAARPFGEQAVVADAVEAFWQDVDEEAADELVDRECHDLLPFARLAW